MKIISIINIVVWMSLAVSQNTGDADKAHMKTLYQHIRNLMDFRPDKAIEAIQNIQNKTILNDPLRNGMPIYYHLHELWQKQAKRTLTELQTRDVSRSVAHTAAVLQPLEDGKNSTVMVVQKFVTFRENILRVFDSLIDHVNVDKLAATEPSEKAKTSDDDEENQNLSDGQGTHTISRKFLTSHEISLATKLFSKSTLIDDVAKAISKKNPPTAEALSTMYKLLEELYHIMTHIYDYPCDTSNLSRLLLGADHKWRSMGKASLESITKEHFMRNHVLEEASKNGFLYSISIFEEMMRYSPRIQEIIQNIGITSKYQGIYLHRDIVTSYDHVISIFHHELLHQFIQQENSSINQDNDLLAAIKISTLGSVMNFQDPSHRRNIIHYLISSGGVKILQQFTGVCKLFISCDVSNEMLQRDRISETIYRTCDSNGKKISMGRLNFKKQLQSALFAMDERDSMPYDYASKWGYESPVFDAVRELYGLIGFEFSQEMISELFPMPLTDSDAKNGSCMELTGDGEIKQCVESLSGLNSDDSGGWDDERISFPSSNKHAVNPSAVINDIDRCDIEVVQSANRAITSEEFYEKYLKRSKPVIFRGMIDKDDKLFELLRKDVFAATYGEEPMPITPIPYGAKFQVNGSMSTASDIISRTTSDLKNLTPNTPYEPSYTFTIPLTNWKRKLQEDIPPPKILQDLNLFNNRTVEEKMTFQFYVGPAGSGAPAHFHINAVNCLAYGEKKWFLYPPSESYYSITPSSHFVLFDEKASKALTCTQRSGDVIFIPSNWGHGTFNTKQSIGVAYEFFFDDFCGGA